MSAADHRAVHAQLERIKPVAVYGYFDKINLRMPQWLKEKDMRFLKENCHRASQRYGNQVRDMPSRKMLFVVNPNTQALRFLAEQKGMWVNYVEVTVDVILKDEPTKDRLTDLFDRCFVQRWHGKRPVRLKGQTRYTGDKKRGVGFVWYPDKPSKITQEPHCFHLEARYQGLPAVRRLEIHEPADLLTFDHTAFWQINMSLFGMDFERLGQVYVNRQSGQKRRKPPQSAAYNRHRRTGGAVYRSLAFDPDFEHADNEEQPVRALHRVQTFNDAYGKGNYMKLVDVSALIPRRQEMDLVDQ